MAQEARAHGWRVEADLNNDIVGGARGLDGRSDNTVVRVFSESPPTGTTAEALPRLLDEAEARAALARRRGGA